MKTPTKILYWIFQWTWGIAQNVLGFLVWLVLTLLNPKRKRGSYEGAILTHWKFSFSTGLGMFIFYGHASAPDAEEVLVHEFGHTLQSALLGPLFLPVIGIPSCVWAFTPALVRRRKETGKKYVDFYPERWANDWGSRVTGRPAPER